jgi:arylsulfatase
MAWLLGGQTVPVAWSPLAIDAALCGFVGLAGSQLRSWPLLQQPAWLLVVLALSIGLVQAPGGLVGVVYLVGLVGLVVVPAVLTMRRVWVPWWMVTLCVPPLVVARYAVDQYGGAYAEGEPVLGALGRDLTWPLHRSTLPPAQTVGPSVIVISVDTLRADSARRMASYRRLAEGGAWWSSAMATSSWTLPSLASLQTGLLPAEHGAGFHEGRFQGVRPDVPTLAEQLAQAGYRTAGVTSNPWTGEANGLPRGFHHYVDLGGAHVPSTLFGGVAFDGLHPQDASVVLERSIDALDRLEGGSFYLWVHLVDPHVPYLHADPATADLAAEVMGHAPALTAGQRQALRDAYEHEVDVLDGQLMAFLDVLQARGHLDDALVVFTSDHGEEFWDHGGTEHGHSHHAEVVEVPLVIRGPGVTPGPRTSTASLVDIAPTVLRAAGEASEGYDLRTAGIPGDRIAMAWGNLHGWPQCSARDARHRAIVDACHAPDARTRSFDLQSDPEELVPDALSWNHPVCQAAEGIEAPEAQEGAAQPIQALKALGYMD